MSIPFLQKLVVLLYCLDLCGVVADTHHRMVQTECDRVPVSTEDFRCRALQGACAVKAEEMRRVRTLLSSRRSRRFLAELRRRSGSEAGSLSLLI